MISVDEAQKVILSAIRPMQVEAVALSDSLGRTLACEVVSPLSHPPWDNSAMDGYAVCGSDIKGATRTTPILLTVTEEIMAGNMPQKYVSHGEAAKIMTGAPMPCLLYTSPSPRD